MELLATRASSSPVPAYESDSHATPQGWSTAGRSASSETALKPGSRAKPQTIGVFAKVRNDIASEQPEQAGFRCNTTETINATKRNSPTVVGAEGLEPRHLPCKGSALAN